MEIGLRGNGPITVTTSNGSQKFTGVLVPLHSEQPKKAQIKEEEPAEEAGSADNLSTTTAPARQNWSTRSVVPARPWTRPMTPANELCRTQEGLPAGGYALLSRRRLSTWTACDAWMPSRMKLTPCSALLSQADGTAGQYPCGPSDTETLPMSNETVTDAGGDVKRHNTPRERIAAIRVGDVWETKDGPRRVVRIAPGGAYLTLALSRAAARRMYTLVRYFPLSSLLSTLRRRKQ